MKNIRVALAQINPTVGGFQSNKDKIIENIHKAKEASCDIVVFPELAITGYHPEDLLFKTKFVASNKDVLNEIIPETKGISVIIGYVGGEGDKLNDSAAVIDDGKFLTHYDKVILPSSGVFDEQRYFIAGTTSPIIRLGGINIGLNISEDIWSKKGPAFSQGKKGAELFINIAASPYHMGKYEERLTYIRNLTNSFHSPFIYTNIVGGQDEMVFDGSSMVLDGEGNIVSNAKEFEEDLLICDIDIPEKACEADIVISEQFSSKVKNPIEIVKNPKLEENAEVYKALVVGTHDYVEKNGFKTVVVGLSGGIDSTLVATIAVDALGADRVKGVAMPSRFSTDHSVKDAEDLVKNIGIDFYSMPIEETYKAYLNSLSNMFEGRASDSTEENIQARIRGNFLMALSNKFGWLVLTTGNKSETATGYTTLYGDMAGGFAVIKDVPKTQVYEICKYRNSLPGVKPVPENVLAKAPSAELRYNQKDSDSLPPYEILDPILRLYVEHDLSVDEIVERGYDKETVKRTARLVDLNEYKRRQGPPGIKITTRSFGRDRRLPITNQYRGV